MRKYSNQDLFDIEALDRPGLFSHMVLWLTVAVIFTAIVWANLERDTFLGLCQLNKKNKKKRLSKAHV